ncbi:hypothetical protein [Roseateles chitinivorans]|uniref:hypothetical protein n=1 Tax=Roseateles chitinivorans TaxID=2917965 RepID=UPI003D67BC61
MALLSPSASILLLAALSASGHCVANAAIRSPIVSRSSVRDPDGLAVDDDECLKQGRMWENRLEIDGIARPWEVEGADVSARCRWTTPSGKAKRQFTFRSFDAFDLVKTRA